MCFFPNVLNVFLKMGELTLTSNFNPGVQSQFTALDD